MYSSEYYNRLKQEIADLPPEQADKAQMTFFEAYEEHRAKFGSFRHLKGDDYYIKMSERNEFMYNRALESIKKKV